MVSLFKYNVKKEPLDEDKPPPPRKTICDDIG